MTGNAQIIDRALGRIVAGYVFPQRAVEIDRAIRARLAAGEYDALDGTALCAAVTEHITVTVPTARTTNAVTGTNWEGVGVRPDRAVAAGKALEMAHQEAIRRLS